MALSVPEFVALVGAATAGIVLIASVVVGVLGRIDDRRTQEAERRGLCPRCGYDLRATPEGEILLPRCPECGLRAKRIPQSTKISN